MSLYSGYTESNERVQNRWLRMKAAADADCGHRFQDWSTGEDGVPYCEACRRLEDKETK